MNRLISHMYESRIDRHHLNEFIDIDYTTKMQTADDFAQIHESYRTELRISAIYSAPIGHPEAHKVARDYTHRMVMYELYRDVIKDLYEIQLSIHNGKREESLTKVNKLIDSLTGAPVV